MPEQKSSGVRKRKKRREQAPPTSEEASNGSSCKAQSNSPSITWPSLLLFGLIGVILILATVSFIRKPEEASAGTPEESRTTEQDESSPARQRQATGTNEHYQVLEVLPHDSAAFTQGLTFVHGKLYEGTGMNGASELRHVEPQTGKVLSSHALEEKYFGEGIAHFDNDQGETCLIQLTWRERKGFIYRLETLEVIREFDFDTSTGEGWGITYDHTLQEFIVSDGSSMLFFWDRDTLKEKRRIEVKIRMNSGERPVRYLNELEWDTDGTILSNVWYQNVLIRIDPVSGRVTRAYDFTKLYQNRTKKADCFNGIAHTDTPGELYVTGKWWPHMYRVKLLV